MIAYNILDYEIQSKRVTVDYAEFDTFPRIYLTLTMPWTQGQWLTGTDLDRYVTLHHRKNKQRNPNELTEEEKVIYEQDQQWLNALFQGEEPLNLPEAVIDQVVAYRQARFLDFVGQASKLESGPRLFLGNGQHTWTVPDAVNYVTISIYTTGYEDIEQGPGVNWSSSCAVTPGDTVMINIGTATTVSSSLGTITCGSGWSDPMSKPRDEYAIEPWGFCGREGAVIIF